MWISRSEGNQILGWKFTKSAAPFLGIYSAGNHVEMREPDGKLLLVERVESQLWVVGLLLSFGLYLIYVLVFHFNEVNGGLFGISVLTLGGLVGIGFGTKAAFRLSNAPAVEFDFMAMSISFFSRTRNRRILEKSILFGNVDFIELRLSKPLSRRSSTEVFLWELSLLSPPGEKVVVCVSGNCQKLEKILEALASKTRINIYSLNANKSR
jgi:hypothetical protein